METGIYLLKSVAVLSIFYVVYFIFLRKDTLFTAKRHYLLTGILTSLLLPLVQFTKTVYLEAPVVSEMIYTDVIPLTAPTTVVPLEASSIDWWLLVLIIYCAGTLLMSTRFFVQLFSLLKLLQKYPSEKRGKFRFIQVKESIAPFSFFRYIVYNPSLHCAEELEMILKHEQVHASQWHSIDIILAHIARSIQWINPFSWLYKKSIEENLEFIADNETVTQISSKKQYQLTLVKASSPLIVPALTTQFYQSFIKKRIIMLNKSTSKRRNIWKLCIVLPLLALFLWSFNVTEVTKYKETTNSAETSNSKEVFRINNTSSENELNRIEENFAKHFQSARIKIDQRERDESGNLVGFSFATKFGKQDTYSKRFQASNQEESILKGYQLQFKEGPAVLVTEMGPQGTQFKITEELLEFTNLNLKMARADKISEEKTEILGENPLYIVNDQAYLQDQLPENTEIKTEEEIIVYDREEGLEKYGVKGKDGVLLINGAAQFVEKEEHSQLIQEREIAQVTTETARRIPPKFRIKITKNTTDAELKRFKKEMAKEHGIDLSYTVVRNSKKEITSINLSYNGNGISGNYSVNDEQPIEDFHFYMSEDGKTGFHNQRSSERLHELHKRREQRSSEREERLHVRQEELKERMEEREALLKERMIEREEEMEERREELRHHQRELAEQHEHEQQELEEHQEELEHVYNNLAHTRRQIVDLHQDHGSKHSIVINKNTSDEKLKELKAMLKGKGVSFSYSKLRRNASGQISRIKIELDNKKGSNSTISAKADDGAGINDIVIEY